MQTQIEQVMGQMREHLESVRPGQPCRITEAWTAGDTAWQGDLGLMLVDAVPEGYVKIAKPTDQDRQLVPGNTQGSKHCLDSLDGVTIYHPKDWGAEGNLRGPCLILKESRTILHPTHGAVTIPANRTILCGYQREYDQELKRARRAAD